MIDARRISLGEPDYSARPALAIRRSSSIRILLPLVPAVIGKALRITIGAGL
jgi:hypothetical protein